MVNQLNQMKPKRVDSTKIIQLVGALNAAIWLGGTVFLTFIAGPALFSAYLEPILPKPESGIAARYLIGKFTTFQIACASIAAITLFVGWRRSMIHKPKLQALILIAIILLIGTGMLILTPKMDVFHQIKYAEFFGLQATLEETEVAAKAFGRLHAFSQIGNLFVLICLLLNFVLHWNMAAKPQRQPTN